MHITLSPQRRDDTLTVTKAGEVLTINGQAYDFSGVLEGHEQEYPETIWIVGAVRREGGVLYITLLLPHAANPPHHVAWPDPIIDPPDGPITLPA